MFFIIDFDDISGGIGGFIKLFLIVGILAIPLGFMKWNDDNLVIGTIMLALCISAFISNILTFVSGLKGIKEKKIVPKLKSQPHHLVRLFDTIKEPYPGKEAPI